MSKTPKAGGTQLPSMTPEQSREGYRAAIQMIGRESKIIWDSFRSLLAANAVLVGFAGAVFKLYPEHVNLTRILSCLGIIVCVAWALITVRAFGYYSYWFAWARKYELGALGSKEQMIQLGEKFSKGDSVEQLGANERFSWFARLFKIQWLAYLVITSFIVIYVYVLVEIT